MHWKNSSSRTCSSCAKAWREKAHQAAMGNATTGSAVGSRLAGLRRRAAADGMDPQRRVVVMRRQRRWTCCRDASPGQERASAQELARAGRAALHRRDQPVKSWEYAVLVWQQRLRGRAHRPALPRPGGLRERLRRNQEPMGWGGYTTHDIERCALSARAVALIYNWWSCTCGWLIPKPGWRPSRAGRCCWLAVVE